jgi:hypothetical protein
MQVPNRLETVRRKNYFETHSFHSNIRLNCNYATVKHELASLLCFHYFFWMYIIQKNVSDDMFLYKFKFIVTVV